jgi:adenosylcobinamide kinase/adenosylcobinamide-phosphate guanylyltransferase
MPASLPSLTLVSGPAASGKSRWAEHLAHHSGHPVVVLATGPDLPDDISWQDRLERHRQRRPPSWRTLEVGGDLSAGLLDLSQHELGLVDSLGTWVAAHLETGERDWRQRCENLDGTLQQSTSPVILVCEETAWGVVPPTDLGLRFRQRLADLQRRLATDCDQTWLVLQGRALDLQALSFPVPPDPRDF